MTKNTIVFAITYDMKYNFIIRSYLPFLGMG